MKFPSPHGNQGVLIDLRSKYWYGQQETARSDEWNDESEEQDRRNSTERIRFPRRGVAWHTKNTVAMPTCRVTSCRWADPHPKRMRAFTQVLHCTVLYYCTSGCSDTTGQDAFHHGWSGESLPCGADSAYSINASAAQPLSAPRGVTPRSDPCHRFAKSSNPQPRSAKIKIGSWLYYCINY